MPIVRDKALLMSIRSPRSACSHLAPHEAVLLLHKELVVGSPGGGINIM
jgi:hypothetical protein